ncbi:MAG: sialate O-acetylesterase, partial [Firmicutes bacterium]|nr:sialate O-acetylesterase [Bacillota bacterium]
MSVHLSPLFSDGMVLQRGSAARLWGRADEPVTVTFVNQTVRAVPDAAGSWHVTLRDLAPGGPYTLTVNEHTLRDVYVGDVWVLAGQSNMQLPMGRARHMYPEEFTRENPNIRQFIVPQRTDFRAPRAELAGGRWAGASQASLADFSAVGYFFAKRLYARYKTPVGLLLTAIGGTPIHAWMGRAMLNEFADLQASADQCADDAYVARVQARDAAETARFFDSIDQTDPGLAGGWHLPAFDDSGWEERPLLAPWEGSGSVWLRRAVEIPPALAGKPATLF